MTSWTASLLPGRDEAHFPPLCGGGGRCDEPRWGTTNLEPSIDARSDVTVDIYQWFCATPSPPEVSSAGERLPDRRRPQTVPHACETPAETSAQPTFPCVEEELFFSASSSRRRRAGLARGASRWEPESGVGLKGRMKYGTHTELRGFSPKAQLFIYSPPAAPPKTKPRPLFPGRQEKGPVS